MNIFLVGCNDQIAAFVEQAKQDDDVVIALDNKSASDSPVYIKMLNLAEDGVCLYPNDSAVNFSTASQAFKENGIVPVILCDQSAAAYIKARVNTPISFIFERPNSRNLGAAFETARSILEERKRWTAEVSAGKALLSLFGSAIVVDRLGNILFATKAARALCVPGVTEISKSLRFAADWVRDHFEQEFDHLTRNFQEEVDILATFELESDERPQMRIRTRCAGEHAVLLEFSEETRKLPQSTSFLQVAPEDRFRESLTEVINQCCKEGLFPPVASLLEQALLKGVLEKLGSRARAREALGTPETTLRRKLKKYGGTSQIQSVDAAFTDWFSGVEVSGQWEKTVNAALGFVGNIRYLNSDATEVLKRRVLEVVCEKEISATHASQLMDMSAPTFRKYRKVLGNPA